MDDERGRAEKEAVRLSDRMVKALGTWLESRGVTADATISGFVPLGGTAPRVLINIDARVAAAIIESITAQRPDPPRQAPPPAPPPPPWDAPYPAPHPNPPPPPNEAPPGAWPQRRQRPHQ